MTLPMGLGRMQARTARRSDSVAVVSTAPSMPVTIMTVGGPHTASSICLLGEGFQSTKKNKRDSEATPSPLMLSMGAFALLFLRRACMSALRSQVRSSREK